LAVRDDLNGRVVVFGLHGVADHRVGESGQVRHPGVYVDARLELAHRRLSAAGRTAVGYALAEALLSLAAPALRRAADRRIPATDPPVAADRRLLARARAAIHDDHPAARGLFPLAALLG
jgi:hypothetical protein